MNKKCHRQFFQSKKKYLLNLSKIDFQKRKLMSPGKFHNIISSNITYLNNITSFKIRTEILMYYFNIIYYCAHYSH